LWQQKKKCSLSDTTRERGGSEPARGVQKISVVAIFRGPAIGRGPPPIGQPETLEYLLAAGLYPNARTAPFNVHPMMEGLRGDVSPRVFASLALLAQAGADPALPPSAMGERSPALAACDARGGEAPPLLVRPAVPASGMADADFALLGRQRQAQAEAQELSKQFSGTMAARVAACVDTWPSRSALVMDLASWTTRVERSALLAELTFESPRQKAGRTRDRRI